MGFLHSHPNSSHFHQTLNEISVAIDRMLVVRGAVVPPGFGKYGHYRAGALDLNRAKPVRFAGQAVCAD